MDVRLNSTNKDHCLKTSITNYLTDFEVKYNSSESSIIKTGYSWIDTKAGGLLNGLTYIGARPSIGKTTFVINVMNNLIKSGNNVIFFNLEMAANDIISKSLAIESRLSSRKIMEADIEEKEFPVLTKACNHFYKENSFLVDDLFNLEEIENFSLEKYNTCKIDAIFIDYLQLIGSKEKHPSRYALVTEVSRRLKLLQKKLKIPIWCLAQMNRNSAGKVPEIHELKESGSIEQDADRVLAQ